MKNLNQIDCVALSALESQQINGGSEAPKSTLWEEISFFGTAIVKGLMVFSTQAGRNAGLTVK